MNPLTMLKMVRVKRAHVRAQKTCGHDFSEPVTIAGKIGAPQCHPHPHWKDRVQVRLQPIATVSVCFLCQKMETSFGYNEHPVEATLPGLVNS